MEAFRSAVDAKDIEALGELFADDIVFRSPIVYSPYQGKSEVKFLLGMVAEIFDDFRYDRVLVGAEGERDHALVFRARVSDREVEGCDFVRVNAAGLVDELTVMVRPLSAAHALAKAMKAGVEAAQGARA